VNDQIPPPVLNMARTKYMPQTRRRKVPPGKRFAE
jgi:hypothetical protein